MAPLYDFSTSLKFLPLPANQQRKAKFASTVTFVQREKKNTPRPRLTASVVSFVIVFTQRKERLHPTKPLKESEKIPSTVVCIVLVIRGDLQKTFSNPTCSEKHAPNHHGSPPEASWPDQGPLRERQRLQGGVRVQLRQSGIADGTVREFD